MYWKVWFLSYLYATSKLKARRIAGFGGEKIVFSKTAATT